jgi:hypothetical protein
MMCRLVFFAIAVISLPWMVGSAIADSFPLSIGGTLDGEPIAFGADGVAVKKSDGTFSSKVAWTNFTQEALKKLNVYPKAKQFVEPFLDIEEDEPAKRAVEIKSNPVPRLNRPDLKAGWGAMFASPLSVMLFILLYLANVYAGYEVSVFRNLPAGLVCGVAAVAPVVGPIVFLCLPTRLQPGGEQAHEQIPAEVAAHGETGPLEGVATEAHAHAAQPVAESAHRLPPPAVYQRGQTTFNRRFFETKLSGFLRVVPSEAEKDMLIHIKCVRGEYVGNRLSRVMPNELYLQVSKAGASSDVIIPFSEISEVQIRHKEA